LDIGLGAFDIFAKLGWVGTVVLVIAAVTEAGDRAIGKAFFHFCTLSFAQGYFYGMGMLGAKFYAEYARLFTVGDQGGQIPILGPLVGDEAKAKGRSGRSITPSKVRKQCCTKSSDGGLLQESPAGKVFWVHPLKISRKAKLTSLPLWEIAEWIAERDFPNKRTALLIYK
jgi:hypothetical protein